jgi:hypothetical protein
VELKRRLYTRGSSYETTIPKPLLFSRNLSKKQIVRFIYDDQTQRWYLEFEEHHPAETPPTEPATRKTRKGGTQ